MKIQVKQIILKTFIVIGLSLLYETLHACDSTATKYFENGKKEVVEKYKEGTKCGIWKFFHPTGVILRREKYKNGELAFTWIYNDKGQLIESINKKGKHKKYKACNCH